MRQRQQLITVFIKNLFWGFSLLALLPILAHAKAGTTAANFLKIGVGARGAAMGGAQVAIADDVNAAYWNPAGLSLMRYQELSVMHYSLVENVRYQNAAYGFPTENRGTFAFGASLLDYGSIAAYTNGGIPNGNVDASNKLFSASWAKQILKDSKLSAGVNIKYLMSDLAGYSASAPMMDAGLLYPFESGRLRGLRLGMALRNEGPSIDYNGTGSPLPRQFVLGGGFAALGGNLVLDLDMIQAKDTGSYAALGAEYKVFDMLRLRLGYTSESSFIGNGFSYGLGIHFTQWNIDYALVPYGDLGNTNRVSVGFRFGRALQIQNASDQVEQTYNKAYGQYAHGDAVQAYGTLSELLLVAPWHKPSAELKAKIEKQFAEMSAGKDAVRIDAEISEKFTQAKEAFDRDELMLAKKGFETILTLDATHTGAQVYLDRIKNRYDSLAHESFKEGMDAFAGGDYQKAKAAFQKTLTIKEDHPDAKPMLDKTEIMIADVNAREAEMQKLAGAKSSYEAGLSAYKDNNYEEALTKFEEVKTAVPDFEEVDHYISLTKVSYSGILFDKSQNHYQNGQLQEAVGELNKASELAPDDSRITTARDIAKRDLDHENSQKSQALYKDGLSAYLSGDAGKAEKNWKQALDLDYTNEDASNALRKLEEKKAYDKAQEQK